MKDILVDNNRDGALHRHSPPPQVLIFRNDHGRAINKMRFEIKHAKDPND